MSIYRIVILIKFYRITNKFSILSRALDNNEISEFLPGHFTGLIKLESLKANKNRLTVADFSDFKGSVYLKLM